MIDDVPVAEPNTRTVPVGTLQTVDVQLIVDISGSMGEAVDGLVLAAAAAGEGPEFVGGRQEHQWRGGAISRPGWRSWPSTRSGSLVDQRGCAGRWSRGLGRRCTAE